MASIWEARGDLFPPESQQGFAQLDSFAGTFFGGRDFGTGVLGSLGKNWRLVVAKQDPTQISPRPDVLLPSFALIAEVNDDDPDFAQRLKAAFQSFVGVANLGAAQQKAPPLMLGTEDFEGQSISTARYLPPKERLADEPVHQRFNFSPSAVQVGNQFVLSSSVALAKELVMPSRTLVRLPTAEIEPIEPDLRRRGQGRGSRPVDRPKSRASDRRQHAQGRLRPFPGRSSDRPLEVARRVSGKRNTDGRRERAGRSLQPLLRAIPVVASLSCQSF